MIYRHRIVIICLSLGVFVGAFLAFEWRLAFPYPDRLAAYVAEDALAYVHVNLTASVRRTIRSAVADAVMLPADVQAAIATALAAPDVRELAVAVTARPSGVGVVVMIGQQQSARLDVVAPMITRIGSTNLFVSTVRTDTNVRGAPQRAVTAALRHAPIQMVVRPRAMIGAVASGMQAVAPYLPETVTASGNVGWGTIVLRTDGGPVRVLLPEKISIPEHVSVGIVGTALPIREWVSRADDPMHRSLNAAVSSIIPDRADVRMDWNPFLMVGRFPSRSVVVSEANIRAIAARIWPTTRPSMLDGIPATVLVADPHAFTVIDRGHEQWELVDRGSGTVRATAIRDRGAFTVTSGELNGTEGDPFASRSRLAPRLCSGDGSPIIDAGIPSTSLRVRILYSEERSPMICVIGGS